MIVIIKKARTFYEIDYTKLKMVKIRDYTKEICELKRITYNFRL